jgi:hypothetical protein
MTKKERAELLAELAQCRTRAREIRALLTPAKESEVMAYLKSKGTCKGVDISTALGKNHSHVVAALSRAVTEGKAKRVGVGEYQAVTA